MLVRVPKTGGPQERVTSVSPYVALVGAARGGIAVANGFTGFGAEIRIITDAGQEVIATGVDPQALGGNHHRVYWRTASTVFAFPGGDGGIERIDAGNSPMVNGWSLSVVDDGVFWNDYDSEVQFTPEDGGPTRTVGQSQGAVGRISAHGTGVIWSNVTLGLVDLVRAPGSPVEVLGFGQLGVEGLVLDDDGAAWVLPISTNVVPAQVVRRPLDGGASYGVASQNDQQLPLAIASDATSLYWLNSDGSVVKCTPK